MSSFNRFVRFLRALVGKHEDIDSIMKPINTIVSKLEAHRAEQLEAAKRAEAAAQAALDQAKANRETAEKAEGLRLKYAA